MTYNDITDRLQTSVADAIRRAFDVTDLPVVEVAIPTNTDKADLVTNIAFQLAKPLSMSPLVIAQTLVQHLAEASDIYIADAAAPGFINFRLTDAALLGVLDTIEADGEQFGSNQILNGQTWLIEHTSPNPNKAMHVGHLRNNLIGMAVARIAKFSGAHVICDCVDNNRGIAIAKAMWGYLVYKKRDAQRVDDVAYWARHTDEWITPEEVGVKPDHFVGTCYTLGAEDAKMSHEVDAKIRDLALRWEAHDADVWKLWERIIGYAHEGILSTLDRVGNHWDHVWHEHEHYEQGRELVLSGLEKGIFRKLDDGAVLSNLESYNIPDTILLKSDGTSLYITQDLALTKLKKNTYKADKLLWVIGPEQSTAMKQVFAICEQLGIGNLDAFVHLPYGLVSIVDESGARKKMSSRGGNTLLIDDLIDTVKAALLEAGREYTEEDAEKIAVSTVKYAILKPSRTTDTAIDIHQAISLEGDSGLYLLYTHARMNTLLHKSQESHQTIQNVSFSHDEHELIVQMLYMQQRVQDALQTYSPNVIVEYLLNMAHDFNNLYAKERFITEDTISTQRKIALTKALSQVFQNCLTLLGMGGVNRI